MLCACAELVAGLVLAHVELPKCAVYKKETGGPAGGGGGKVGGAGGSVVLGHVRSDRTAFAPLVPPGGVWPPNLQHWECEES